MSAKRSNDNSTALAIPLNKKSKSELVAYAAKNRKVYFFENLLNLYSYIYIS